jgi:hypothetical protein
MSDKHQVGQIGQEWLSTKSELKRLGKKASVLRKQLNTLEQVLLTHMKDNNLSTVTVNDKEVYISMKLNSD